MCYADIHSVRLRVVPAPQAAFLAGLVALSIEDTVLLDDARGQTIGEILCEDSGRRGPRGVHLRCAPMTTMGLRQWNSARIREWRQRGLDLWGALRSELSEEVVPWVAIEWLLNELINEGNPVCWDGSNAAHVMAQNDNLVVLARWSRASSEAFAIALAAGFIHDLNKARDEPLRQDRWCVREQSGRPLTCMSTEAEVVGLNHYGERTRAALETVVRLGKLSPMAAEAIDHCILHHGLGSSRFIQQLVRGRLGYGREDFMLDDGSERLVLPAQMQSSLSTVLHDLADSVQQMQAGAAWVAKYPLGYWRHTSASWVDLLSGDAQTGDMPTGLMGQLRVEFATCQSILDEACYTGIISHSSRIRLKQGIEALTGMGRAWVDDRPETLIQPEAQTIYHQIGQFWGVTPSTAYNRMGEVEPGQDEELDIQIVHVARVLDASRARLLRRLVTQYPPVVV